MRIRIRMSLRMKNGNENKNKNNGKKNNEGLNDNNHHKNKKTNKNRKNKNIVIGRPFTKYNIEPDVFIPCGIPGVDFKGHIFRTDNVVSLPLSSLRLSHSKSVQQVLREIIK